MYQTAVAEPARLLEREYEVGCIRAAVHGAERGAGAALLIEGSAGIGKSRLLDEALGHARDLGLRVLYARATELEQGFPFGVVRQLFERPLVDAAEHERDLWLGGAASLAAEIVTGAATATAPDDSGYAWQHGLYWLASNMAVDSPVVVVVDDLQWCDAPSARALAFIARRLQGQPLALIVATRPIEPAVMPEAATLLADPTTALLRPAPLTDTAVRAFIAARLTGEPEDRFIRACLEVTDGNPFLLGELLDEAAVRGLAPSAGAADDLRVIVPRGVANAVLLRLARLSAEAQSLAHAVSVLGDCVSLPSAATLARLDPANLEPATAELLAAGVIESGATVRFSHPILRTAIYEDLSAAERERMHRSTATILRDRGNSAARIAPHVMQTAPAGDPEAAALLRTAARDALTLGDAAGAAALLSRALEEPPPAADRATVLFELGQALARAGSPEAIALLTQIAERSDDAHAVAVASIELGNLLLVAGRAAEGAVILRRARERLPAEEPARNQLDVALMGISFTSAVARREASTAIAELQAADRSAPEALPATTLAALAFEEMTQPRSADSASGLAERALAGGLPSEPHRAWPLLAVAVLAVADRFEAATRHANAILADAREHGAALTVASVLAHRAFISQRRGDLIAAEADAQAAIELASDLLGSEFVLVLAVPAAVLAGLDRDETPESLRRLIDRSGFKHDTEFIAGSQLRYASALLRGVAGNHEAAIEEMRSWAADHPDFGGANPAMIPWRSGAALSLAELGRHDEARALAADEVRRAQAFGAPRAVGIALRAEAIVGPREERSKRLEQALAVLESSPARLERARVLLDLGATLRAAGRRRAAQDPLREALALATRCGAETLARQARTELAAIGIRPRITARTGVASLTPSERRVVELAAGAQTNREIAQALFVTEKTVETHLGRSFRKLNVSSRRQLPDALASSASG